jgi:hypothetical protein
MIDEDEMLDLVRLIKEHHYAKLTGWESDFINDMSNRLEVEIPITDRQAEKINEIFDRYST